MPSVPYPGVQATGKLANSAASTRRNLVGDLKDGCANPWHYWDQSAANGGPSLTAASDIAGGAVDARGCLAAADAAGPIRLPPGTYRVASDITITRCVHFAPGALLKPDDDITVTLGAGFSAGESQHVFDVSAGGSIVIALQPAGVTPHQFGATGALDHAAFAASVETAMRSACRLYIPGLVDLSSLSAAINVTSNLTIDGNGSMITGPGITQSLFEVVAASGATIHCHNVVFSEFLRVFNLQGNSDHDPYTLEISDCGADNMGGGIVGSGGGVYCKFTNVHMANLILTNVCKKNDTLQDYAIDLKVIDADAIRISDCSIDGVGAVDGEGEPTHQGEVGGIRVAFDDDGAQYRPVAIINNQVRNVRSAVETPSTAQVVGIHVERCQVSIQGNTVDTVEAPASSSSPEAIYTKCPKSLISNNLIIDVLGAEGCIVMKSQTTDDSACIGNLICYRDGVAADKSIGIYLGGRNITASGNMISGCTTGMLLGWDNSVVTGNTMRDIADHGINFVAAESIASLTIRNNVFDRIGLESNDGSYGLMLTLGSSLTISRIDVRDNAFHVFEGATQFAFRLIHTSSGAVDKLLFADNFLDDVITGLSISTATANEIDHIEFARNSMYGVTTPLSSNAASETVHTESNVLNGTSWAGNSASRKEGQDTVTYSSSPTIDFDAGAADNKIITLAGNASLTLAATRAGEYGLALTQDATGGRSVIWPGTVKTNPRPLRPSGTSVYQLRFDGAGFHVFPSTTAFTPQVHAPTCWWDPSDVATAVIQTGYAEVFDLSGHGHQLTQATDALQPAQVDWGNGRDCMSFDGSDDYLAIAALPQASARHFFLVIDSTNLQTGIRMLMANDGSSSLTLNLGTDENYKAGLYWGGGPHAKQASARQAPTIYEFVANSGFVTRTRINDDDDTLVTGSSGSQATANWARLGSSNGGQYPQVLIGEVLGFPAELSAAARHEICGYLAHRWGLAGALPDGHIYKAAPPTL